MRVDFVMAVVELDRASWVRSRRSLDPAAAIEAAADVERSRK
jgi:hypothetical protein